MRLTAAFVAHELRVQARSLRARMAAIAFLGVTMTPPLVVYARTRDVGVAVGGATYAAETLAVLPVAAALVALALSVDGIERERQAGAWAVLTLAPVSGAGYLLRRWAGLLALLLPLSALPLAVAAGLAIAAGAAPAAAHFTLPWLTRVAPATLAASALALAAGTVAGGAVVALAGGVVAAALGLVAVDRLLLAAGVALPRLGEWLGTPELAWSVQRLRAGNGGGPLSDGSFPEVASEAAPDAAVGAWRLVVEGGTTLALAALALALAVSYLRRCRRDLAPRPVRPGHPLRTFLRLAGRLRVAAAFDAAPGAADRAAKLLLVALAVALVVLPARRMAALRELGDERLAVDLAGWPEPTPADVLPERWRVAGRLSAAGRLELGVEATMANLSGEPREHLAFSLAPELTLTAATAGRGRLGIERRRDRLAVRLEPALAPGERRRLVFRLAGNPGEVRFFGVADAEAPFYHSFIRYQRWLGAARFSADLLPFAETYRAAATAGGALLLRPDQLGPVPRYTTWRPIAPGDDPASLRVPEEALRPPADVELELALPAAMVAADSCGGVTAGGVRRAPPGRCRVAPASFVVAGGRRYRRVVTPPGSPGLLVLAAHRGQGRLHAPSLTAAATLAAEAWPSAGDLSRTVVVERSPAAAMRRAQSLAFGWRPLDTPVLALHGGLALLDEAELVSVRPLGGSRLAAEVVATRLASRRPGAAGQRLLFSRLYRQVALEILGYGPAGGAVIAQHRGGAAPLLDSALQATPADWSYWHVRFPALVAALARRTGQGVLRDAVDRFTAAGGEPAELAGLFAALAERTEAPLDDLWQAFTEAEALPVLRLDGVRFRRRADGWVAVGTVVNDGGGSPRCTVALLTDLAPVTAEVRPAAGGAAPFRLFTPHRPQAVVLDPDGSCHRYRPTAAAGRERVEHRGEAER